MTLSGLCTMGMTIADLSDSGHHGGDIDLSGIQYIVGARFVLIGSLIWWADGPYAGRLRALQCRLTIRQTTIIPAILLEKKAPPAAIRQCGVSGSRATPTISGNLGPSATPD
jgi:hypothetical protein